MSTFDFNPDYGTEAQEQTIVELLARIKGLEEKLSQSPKCTAEEYCKLLEIAQEYVEETRDYYYYNYCSGPATPTRQEDTLKIYTNELKFVNELIGRENER